MTQHSIYHVNYLDRENRIADVSYHPYVKYHEHCDRVSRISIVLNGELKETVGSTDIYAQTASIVIKPSSVRHKNVFGPRGARLISLIVEEGFIESLFPKDYSPWRWYQGLSYSSSVCQFLYALNNFPGQEQLEESMMELISVLLEPALGPLTGKPDWLNRVREKIEDLCSFHRLSS